MSTTHYDDLRGEGCAMKCTVYGNTWDMCPYELESGLLQIGVGVRAIAVASSVEHLCATPLQNRSHWT
jgi:hypothetical protein